MTTILSATQKSRSGIQLSSALDRRRFLRSAAAAITAPYFVPSSVFAAPGRPGANDRLNIGVIGTGNRMRTLSNWAEPSQMRFVALADCSTPKMVDFINGSRDHLGRDVPGVKDRFPEVATCNRYENYREMLDKEKLDGVFVTTPTHGRVLPCIHACQAGIDIYAEKPVTLTIEEGQALVEAVNKYDRVFQSGTQARSIAVNNWAVEQLRSGRLGRIKNVLSPNFYAPVEYEPVANAEPIPDGVNWDLWCNQAPLFPYDPIIAAQLENGWGPYRPFDNGGERWGLTCFGTHAFDQILWAINRETESPVEAHPHTSGDPNCAVTLKFADGFEIELMKDIEKGPAFGGIFSCSDGKMEINRYRVATNPKDVAEQLPSFDSPHTAGTSHVQNWIDCIRTRAKTRCPVEVAQRQTTICHIITVVRDLGRDLRYDPTIDRFIDDADANNHSCVKRHRRAGYELPDVI